MARHSYSKVEDYIYEDEDGIRYDLTDLRYIGGTDLEEHSRLWLKASKDGEKPVIIGTDAWGGGMFAESGDQLVGTSQAHLPETDEGICAWLRDWWDGTHFSA